MIPVWTRRRILLGGAALLTSACSGRSQQQPAERHILYADEPARARAGKEPPALRYVVQPGDTLAGIARRSGVAVAAIIDANRLDTHLISPGQVLLLPGAQGLGSDPLAARLAQREQLAEAEAAAASRPGEFRIVPRGEWAVAALGTNRQALGAVNRITIHHTGEHRGMIGRSDVEIVRMIDRYHREERKWAGIGYHYLIGHDGRIYEGRPATIQGAHVSGANEHNLGISCIGDFHRGLPPARQLAALHGFLDAQRRRHGVGAARTYGHRDLGQSICPGDALHRWLVQYKARA